MNKFIEATDTLKSWIGSYEIAELPEWVPIYAPPSEFGARKKRKYTRKKK